MGKIKSNVTNKMIYAGLLIIGLAIYFLLYANKVFPFTEGWGINYVALMEQGKFPYRDFYFYLPPVNLLVDTLLWKLGQETFIGYRLLRLAERLIMAEVIYFLLARWFKNKYAAFATFVGIVFMAGSVYDLMGDYSQTAEFLVVLTTFCAVKFAETDESRKQNRALFMAGVFMSLAFLMKQTHGTALILVCFLFLSFYCWAEKDHAYGRYCVFTIAGFLVPLTVCAAILAMNGALVPCIQQAYLGGDSKGGLLQIFLGSVKTVFLGSDAFGTRLLVDFFALAILWAGAQTAQFAKKKKKNSLYIVRLMAIVLAVAVLYWHHAGQLYTIFAKSIQTGYTQVIVVLSAVLLVIMLRAKNPDTSWGQLVQILGVGGILGIGVGYLYGNVNQSAEVLYYQTDTAALVADIGGLTVYATFLLMGLMIGVRVMQGRWIFPKPIAMLLCGACCSCYASVMSSGGSLVPIRIVALALPVLLCLLFEIGFGKQRIWSPLVVGALCVGITFTFSQKVCSAYSWWGNSTGNINEKTEVIEDIPALVGFKFTPREKNMWEQVTTILRENTTQEDVILNFPYTPIFNILADNYNMAGFVPVYFFDVCTDQFASDDAKTFQENPPDVVVWCDLGTDCWWAHEATFRGDERCGQRDIQEWLAEAVSAGEYIKIGQVENLFIYKLDNGQAPKYTYVQSDSKENTTLQEASLRKEPGEITLKGEGTQKEPYIISSVEDLQAFRDLVNDGESFADRYVKQTQDIDLQGIGDWIPIAPFDEGMSFMGTYDGGGYCIDNMTVQSDENNGLFGVMDGVVLNLEVTNCSIKGSCAGAITSHGAGTVLNCYTSGTVNGIFRAAGIADNISGAVVLCASDCNLVASPIVMSEDGKTSQPAIGEIISYAALEVDFCLIDSVSLPATFTGSTYHNQTATTLQQDIHFLNKSVHQVVDNRLVGKDRVLCLWSEENGHLVLDSANTVG